MPDNESFEIEIGPAVRRHIESKKSPLDSPGIIALPYDQPGSDQTPVFVAENVMRGIEELVGRDKDREVGGVLLGEFYRTDKSSYVEITDFIEAKSTKGTDVSLTFTHETWEQINAEQAKRPDAGKIVGWYHSHPGLGVFMSKEDEFIHSSFFTDPWHSAMVVDPIYSNWGCFKWKDGALERTGGFYVFGEKKSAKRIRNYIKTISSIRQSAPRSASASADRRSYAASSTPSVLWAIIVVMLILQIITGYYAFFRKQAQAEEPNYYARAMELLSASDLSDGARYLRQELITSPGNEQAYKELQRLDRIFTSDTKTPGAENLDYTNLMIKSADKLARGEMTYRERSSFEDLDLLSGSTSGFTAQLESDNPARAAAQIYEWAARTRDERLARAELIKKKLELADGASAPGSAKKLREKTAWYGAAVNWLREEKLRRIAYGLQAGEPAYQPEYDRLPSADKKTVRRIRAELIKAK